MLAISVKDDTRAFHIGDKIANWALYDGPIVVYADGDELDFIEMQFHLPRMNINRATACSWTGDDARFIIANWR